MVKIEQASCIGCGQCIADCVNGLIQIEHGKAVVQNENCNRCSHCVAICPQKAILIEELPQDITEYTKETAKTSPEQLLNLVRFRRSIRQYQEREIAQQVLEQILEAGRFMPTGSNTQDVQYTVVQKNLPEVRSLVWEGLKAYVEKTLHHEAASELERRVASRIQKLVSQHDTGEVGEILFFQAPVLLVISANAVNNAVLAAAAIELMANACGLGCLFSGFIQRGLKNSPAALEKLDLDGNKICITMLLGYPAVSYCRSAQRKPVQVSWR